MTKNSAAVAGRRSLRYRWMIRWRQMKRAFFPFILQALPCVECSGIVKDVSSYINSRMGAFGAAWARHRWYGCSYLVFPNGTLLSGNDGDDYSNKYNGVGDSGVNRNRERNCRFNVNIVYSL